MGDAVVDGGQQLNEEDLVKTRWRNCAKGCGNSISPDSPVILLSCFHLLCSESCAQKVKSESKGSLACPTCKLVIPSEDLDNKVVLSRRFPRIISVQDVKLLCEFCVEGNSAISYCQDCPSNLCVTCDAMHPKLKVCLNHKVVRNLEERSKELLEKMRKESSECGVHKGVDATQFCTKCELKFCCSKECLAKHEKCDGVVNANDERETLLTKVNEAKKFGEDLDKAIDEVKKQKRELRPNMLECLGQTKREFAEIIGVLKERHERFIMETTKAFHERSRTLNDSEKGFEIMKKFTTEYTAFISKAMEHFDTSGIANLSRSSQHFVSSLEKWKTKLENEFNELVGRDGHYVVDINRSQFSTLVDSMCSIQLKYGPHPSYSNRDSETAKVVQGPSSIKPCGPIANNQLNPRIISGSSPRNNFSLSQLRKSRGVATKSTGGRGPRPLGMPHLERKNKSNIQTSLPPACMPILTEPPQRIYPSPQQKASQMKKSLESEKPLVSQERTSEEPEASSSSLKTNSSTAELENGTKVNGNQAVGNGTPSKGTSCNASGDVPVIDIDSDVPSPEPELSAPALEVNEDDMEVDSETGSTKTDVIEAGEVEEEKENSRTDKRSSERIRTADANNSEADRGSSSKDAEERQSRPDTASPTLSSPDLPTGSNTRPVRDRKKKEYPDYVNPDFIKLPRRDDRESSAESGSAPASPRPHVSLRPRRTSNLPNKEHDRSSEHPPKRLKTKIDHDSDASSATTEIVTNEGNTATPIDAGDENGPTYSARGRKLVKKQRPSEDSNNSSGPPADSRSGYGSRKKGKHGKTDDISADFKEAPIDSIENLPDWCEYPIQSGNDRMKTNDEDFNEDYCCVCLDGGDEVIVCCDFCPKVFHQKCHLPVIDEIPEDPDAKWHCNYDKTIDQIREEVKDLPGSEDEQLDSTNPKQFIWACKFLLEMHKIPEIPTVKWKFPEVYLEKYKTAPYHLKFIREKLCIPKKGNTTPFESVKEYLLALRQMFLQAFMVYTTKKPERAPAIACFTKFKNLVSDYYPAHVELFEDIVKDRRIP